MGNCDTLCIIIFISHEQNKDKGKGDCIIPSCFIQQKLELFTVMRAIKSLKESANFTHLEEYTASRALQEESEKQSYEFLKLFVCGSMKMKQENKLNHSKIATWEDYQEKASDRKAEEPEFSTKKVINREINYARCKLIRKKVEKMHTESTDYRSKQIKEEQEVQKQPIFSISVLNPKIEDEGVKSEEKIRVKTKIPSNFMSNLATPQFQERQEKKVKARNARVQSLKHSEKEQKEEIAKIPFIDLSYSLPDCKPSQYLNARIQSAAAVGRFSKKNSAASGLKQKKIPFLMDKIVRQQKRNASQESIHRLKRSSQFQKLRQLLNLQKL